MDERLEEMGKLLSMAEQLRGYPNMQQAALKVESRLKELNDEISGTVKLHSTTPAPGQPTGVDPQPPRPVPATVETLSNPEPVERRM